MDDRLRLLLTDIASKIDFEALFGALPEAEFAAMIDDRLEKIEEEKRLIVASETRIAALQREADAFQGALRVKRELQERREQETGAMTLAVEPLPSPRDLMQRKRSAVLRVLRADADRLMSPEQTEEVIRQRGLLSLQELEAGTPIRIVMAKLAKELLLERPRPGRYRPAATAANQNGASPRVQTEGPTSPQETSPEEVAPPPAGQPIATKYTR